jgi:hypothetical protein
MGTEQFSCPASDTGCAPLAFFIGKLEEHARETNRRLDTIESKLDSLLQQKRQPSWLANASSALSADIGAHAGKMAVVVILVTLATIFGLSPSRNFVPELSPLQGVHQ